MSEPRNVFISHATPEDNVFANWLAAKLTLAGYDVWHDLGRLKGGHYFWQKIENAIRHESIRFLAVVSPAAMDKDGVRNEWELAAALEKARPGFVIPLRIGDVAFADLPITMFRKNGIDFVVGWHHGLRSLLDALAESGTPRNQDPAAVEARKWLDHIDAGRISLKSAPETLESNWLPILEMPPSMESCRIRSSARRIPVTQKNRRLPWFELNDRIVSFAKASEIAVLMADEVALTPAGGIETESFLTNGTTWGDERVSSDDARRRASNLVRQAWELSMEAAGLKPHLLSNGFMIHYVPLGGDRFPFVDVDGKTRKRALAGTSKKRKANWHYAVGIRPAFDELRRVELRSHIVFTGDDSQPLASVARAHRLRRGFCRNWWNDRWRGFIMAFVAFLAKDGRAIRLPVGEERDIVISATPVEFESPISLSDALPIVDDEPDDDAAVEDGFEEVDELDDDQPDEAEA